MAENAECKDFAAVQTGDPRPMTLDFRVEAMQRYLEKTSPSSPTAALKSLREVFPDASLQERVQALTFRH